MAKKILNYLEKKKTYAEVVKGGEESQSGDDVFIISDDSQPGESEVKTSWISGFKYRSLSTTSSSSSSCSSATPKQKKKKRTRCTRKVEKRTIIDLTCTSSDQGSEKSTSRRKRRRIAFSSTSSSSGLPDLEESKPSPNSSCPEYFEGNTNLPIYKSLSTGIKTKEAVSKLMSGKFW